MTFVPDLMVESFSFPIPYCPLFWSLMMCHFLVANFEDLLSGSFNLLSFHFYTYQTTTTEFYQKSKVVSSFFSIIKNIFALLSSSLRTKLICCFKSGFSNSICLLKYIAINL